MVAIDYMAHQEQYAPDRLLEFAERAQDAGVDLVWTSDHFHPWFHTDAEAGRDPDAIETTVLVIAAYDPDYERAVEATRPWHATTQDVFDRGLANPERIEVKGENATREAIEEKFLIADDPSDVAAAIEGYAEQGFDRVALGNTSPDPGRFLDVLADEVVPALR